MGELSTSFRPKSDLLVMVISLKADHERRELLSGFLETEFPGFSFFDAVDMRNHVGPLPIKRPSRKGMTPVEVGCALSHIGVLQVFISSANRYCLVLEDDVISEPGAAAKLQGVRGQLDHLEAGQFIHCGGLQGLRNNRYVRGKVVHGSLLRRLSPWSRPFLSRACAYMLDRRAAEEILSRQGDLLTRADDWERLLVDIADVHYAGIFKHPVDLTMSHMEGERRQLRGTVLQRLLDDGFITTLRRAVSKFLIMSTSRIRQEPTVSVE